MRQAFLLLMAALPLGAEFLQLEVTFAGIGCASCIDSLERRLGRVRGVEQVKVDAERSLVSLQLAPQNRVRLHPLLSRITQDGTKVVSTVVVVRGAIIADEQGHLFQPTGLSRKYRLEASKMTPQPGTMYEVRGVVPGAERVLKAESVRPYSPEQ